MIINLAAHGSNHKSHCFFKIYSLQMYVYIFKSCSVFLTIVELQLYQNTSVILKMEIYNRVQE